MLMLQSLHIEFMIDREKYLFKYPPDLQLCKKHRRASRIFKKYSNKASTQDCECCDRSVGDENPLQKSIFFDPLQLVLLGPGLPLFFGFIKNAIFLILTFIILYAAFCLFDNKITGNCLRDQRCGDNFIDTFSILNEFNSLSSIEMQLCFMLVYTVASVIVLQFLRNQVQKLNQKCDFLIDSPSDYAIMVRRLPQNVKEQDIKDMIQQVYSNLSSDEKIKAKNININQIILSYSMKNYRKIKQTNIENFKKCIKDNKHQSFVQQPFQGFKQSGDVCIVVFQRQQTKDLFKYEPTLYQKLLNFLWSPCVPQSNFKVKGERVCVQRAPQPDDIIWENANVEIEEAIKRKTKYNLAAFGLLLVGCGLQYGLALAQQRVQQGGKKIISIISSILISLSNFGILEFLRYASLKEKNLTHTEYSSVLIVKISILQFMNAGVFLLISKCLAANSFELTDTLILEINTIMVLNGLSHSFFVFVMDHFEISNKIWLYLEKVGLRHFTQIQANELHQTPLPDIPYKYSYILKTLWLTAFYTSFVPFSAFYTFIGFVLNYFLQKKLFASTYSAPRMFSSALNDQAVRLMDFFPLSVSFGGLAIFIYSSQNVSGLCFVYFISSLAISLSIVVFPFQKLTRKLFDSQSRSSFYYEVYSEMQKNFEMTYEMANPAYPKKKKKVHSDKIKKKLMIGDFTQIYLDMDSIVSGIYQAKIQKAIYQVEEQRLRNQQEIVQNQKQQKLNKALESDMYDLLTRETGFVQKQRETIQQSNPTEIRRRFRQLQIYNPIIANDAQNRNKYYGNEFKNFVEDKDRIKNIVGCPFSKNKELKDITLSETNLDEREKSI